MNFKNDFQILRDNKELTYLDSAATSLTPDVVVEEMMGYYLKYNAPVHRGIYDLAQTSSLKYENSRDKIAKFFNVDSNEIIFTKSTTSSLNNVARSLEKCLKEGNEIIVTNLEHHANFLPWQVLCKEMNLKLKIVESKKLEIDVEDILKMITENTKVISIHHVSNVIGNVVDVERLCNEVRKINENIIIVIDGAQAAPHMKVDLKNINCDFYAISAHKMFGPTGLGVLYINKRLHNLLEPFEYGGDMVTPSSVDIDKFNVKLSPLKFEAGTPNIDQVIGFAKAIEYVESIGIEKIEEHTLLLKEYFKEKYVEISDMCEVYNLNNKSPLVTFNINNVAVHDAISSSPFNDVTFNKFHIALRDGQMCNNLTMKYVLDVKAVLRASFSIYNTKEDVDKLIDAIKAIYKMWN